MAKVQKKDSVTGPQGTQVFNADDVNRMIAGELLHSSSDDARMPALVGVSKSVNGQKFVLNQHKLEVGRRPNSDIVLKDSSVSSIHAHIIQNGSSWKVFNLLSSNGTYVNGKKVAESVIVPGDRVSFAGAEFLFMLIDEPVPQRKPFKHLMLMSVGLVLLLGFAGLIYLIL